MIVSPAPTKNGIVQTVWTIKHSVETVLIG
jgi:hypothetical protein